jgi:hypothetical protein
MKRLKNYYTFLREAQETEETSSAQAQAMAPPEVNTNPTGKFIKVYFGPGMPDPEKATKKDPDGTGISETTRNQYITDLTGMLRQHTQLPELVEFLSKYPSFRPALVAIKVMTSNKAGGKVNTDVAARRQQYMVDLCIEAFRKIGVGQYRNVPVKDNFLYELISKELDYQRSRNEKYFSSNIDQQEESRDRYGYVLVNQVLFTGLDDRKLDQITTSLENAKGWLGIGDDDEDAIVKAIEKLQNYSDLVTLNQKLKDRGGLGLQDFLNSVITNGLTKWGDDKNERKKIVDHINKISNTSGKGTIAGQNSGGLVINFQ